MPDLYLKKLRNDADALIPDIAKYLISCVYVLENINGG